MAAPVPNPPPCVNHADAPARYFCRRCGAALCDACVRNADAAPSPHKACAACGSPVAIVDTAPVSPDRVEDMRPLLPRLLESPLYPLRGSGWALLLGAAVVFIALDLLGRFAVYAFSTDTIRVYFLTLSTFTALLLPLAGYLAALPMRIIHHTAQGEAQLPDWPDLTELYSDILRPVILLLGVGLISFAPAIAWSVAPLEPRWLLAVLTALGALYAPMALLAVSVHDSLLAANPWTVLLAVARTWRDYLTLLGALAILAAVVLVAQWVRELLPMPGWALASFALLYTLVIAAHALGQLYHANRYKLRWIHRPDIRPLDDADDEPAAPPAIPPRDRGPIDLA